jgi:ubiquitin-conjugating enzyme E2 J1
MSTPTFSRRNTGVRRIHADIKEMQKDPSDQYYAMPLDDNLFDWHFTLRGPEDTEFEGGVYHGRIILPAEYPFKPPNIVFLNRNGRFEINKKICLSFSAYHPEEWQPAWGVRTILEALISFMPAKSEGSIGSLNWTPEERKQCAKESLEWSCPTCKQKIKDILPPLQKKVPGKKNKYADQVAQMHFHEIKVKKKSEGEERGSSEEASSTGNVVETAAEDPTTLRRRGIRPAAQAGNSTVEENGEESRTNSDASREVPTANQTTSSTTEIEFSPLTLRLQMMAVIMFVLMCALLFRKIYRGLLLIYM